MIATKLLIQSILGLGAIAGVASGGYMLMGSSNENNFFVVVVASESSTDLTDDLYTAKTKEAKEIKNFKCQITGSTDAASTDEDCEIFALPEFDTTNKSIKYAQLESSNTKVTEKAKLITDKFFKLKINKTKMSSLKLNTRSPKTIDLVSTKSTEANKKYATLNLLVKQENNKLEGKTAHIVGKASKKTDATVTGTVTFTCKVNEADTASACDVYKFTNQPGENKDHNDLNFSAVSAPTAWTDITNDHYYLIDLKNNKYDLSANETTRIIVASGTDSTSSTFNVTTSSPLIATIKTSASSNKVIFLK